MSDLSHLFHFGFAMVKRGLGAMLGTTSFGLFALIQAKEHMVAVIGSGRFGHGAIISGSGQAAHAVQNQGIGPQPTQPLRQAVEADETALLPDLQPSRELPRGLLPPLMAQGRLWLCSQEGDDQGQGGLGVFLHRGVAQPLEDHQL